MVSPTTILIGSHEVGRSQPTFVIAEAGVNHNGSVELAHRLVDAAAEAHADAVKFQAFDPASLAAENAPLAQYQREAVPNGDQRSMLEELALSAESIAALQRHAADRGVTFLASPFDISSAALLDRQNIPAFKIASGELTNHLLLEQIAKFGRPMLVSTGMATLQEVADALLAISRSRPVPVALFHCVSSYPASPSDCNLLAMRRMELEFAVPTGWSDHTVGTEIAVAAVALGARLVEKHLTLDRHMIGPDHAASIEPTEFAGLVRAIRDVSSSLGDGQKQPTPAELDVARVARRSLHWAESLEAGIEIQPHHIVALRPGVGFPPSQYSSVVGAHTLINTTRGQLVQAGDLFPPPHG
jgi:N-acetylneuraminate synthase/N,N'-diacetyllegionaminate synthase